MICLPSTDPLRPLKPTAADERLSVVHKEHLLALAEAKKEKQLMQEDFERRLAALSAATNAAPSANTLTPESAAPPASGNTETNNTTCNIQNDLSEDDNLFGKDNIEQQGDKSEASDDMDIGNSVAHQGNESDASAGITVGNSSTSSSEDSSDDNGTDVEREHSSNDDNANQSNNLHDDHDPTTRKVVTTIFSDDSRNSDGDDDDSSDGKYGEDSDEIGSTSDHVEYVGTTAPTYSMYGISDAKDKHDDTLFPNKADETNDSFISDSEGDWASNFDSLPVKIIAKVSTTSKGTTLALAQKQTKKLTLSDLKSSDVSAPSPGPSPDRFRKNKDIRYTFSIRDTMNPDSQRSKTSSQSSSTAPSLDNTANSNTRYPLRSRAATTTVEPDGRCSP